MSGTNKERIPELGLSERLELYRRCDPDPALGEIADLEAALASDSELALRHLEMESHDDAVRASVRQSSAPERLRSTIAAKLAKISLPAESNRAETLAKRSPAGVPVHAQCPPRAENAGAGRARRPVLRGTHWVIAATIVAAAVLWRHWPFGGPRISLESLAAEARQVYREILDGAWERPGAETIAAAGWPEELSIRHVVGMQSVELAGMRVWAVKLSGRGQTAIVFLAMRDRFPEDFEFERIDNSGEPVKVLAFRDVAAVVIAPDERGLELANPPPTLIGAASSPGAPAAA